MNPTNFLPVYAYVGGLLLCLAVIILTSHGLHDSERRVFPDITLERALEQRTVTTGSRTRIQLPDQHRVETPEIIDTDYVLPSRAKVNKDLIVKGAVTIGNGTKLNGSVKASGQITLGPDVLIEGNLISESGISVGPGAEVLGILHAKDSIWLMPSSSVSLSVVSTGTVYIHEGVRVGKRISAGGGIEYLSPPRIFEGPEEIQPSRPVEGYVNSSFTSSSGQFFEPVCHVCRSPLSSNQWRCLTCGSYRTSPNNVSSPIREAHG